MDNPNEYDDEAYLKAHAALIEAVASMWEAGADEDDIMDSAKSAIGIVE